MTFDDTLLIKPSQPPEKSRWRRRLRRCMYFPTFLVMLLFLIIVVILYFRLSCMRRSSMYWMTETSYSPRSKHFPNMRVIDCVVIDAGNTATNIHVYNFEMETDGRLALLKDISKAMRPGLPELILQADQAAVYVAELLTYAKENVPKHRLASTPLSFHFSTQNLTLVQSDASTTMTTLKGLVKRTLFYKPSQSYISTLKDYDIGLYTWMGMNYLSGVFSEKTVTPQFGVLVLGEESTEVAFSITNEATLSMSPEDSVFRKKVYWNFYNVYSKGYRNLGLKSARLAILNESVMAPASDVSSSITVDTSQVLINPCFPKEYTNPSLFSERNATLIGSDLCSLESCRELAKHTIKDVDSVEEMKQVQFFLGSLFYEIAERLRLVDGQNGMEVLLKDFITEGQQVCSRGNIDQDPFLCLDVAYIVALLTDGYRLLPHQRFVVKRTIREFEVSWTVGLALELTQSLL